MAAHVEIRKPGNGQEPLFTTDYPGIVSGPGTAGSPSGGVQSVQSPGRTTATGTIASGASLSGAVDLGVNYMASRLTMPAAWTAAHLTFQVSADGVTYNELRDATLTAVEFAVDASYDIALDPAVWIGVRYVKVRSGTASVPVNQGGARTITFTTVPC